MKDIPQAARNAGPVRKTTKHQDCSPQIRLARLVSAIGFPFTWCELSLCALVRYTEIARRSVEPFNLLLLHRSLSFFFCLTRWWLLVGA